MTPMLRAVGLAVGLTLSRCSEDVSTGDDADYWDDDSYGFSVAEGFCAFQCDPAYLGDGECDDMCNVEACDWDGTDCFHGYGECYSHPDGSDYRGALNHTESGYPCQKWSAQWPQRHTRIHTNFPHAGLGGHSSCRNPDNEVRPWCYTTAPETRWEYCAIPPLQPSCHHNPSHSREAPSAARPLDEAGSGDTERNPYNLSFYGFDYYSSYDMFPSVVFERDIVKALPLNKLIHGQLDEHTYVFYEVWIPASPAQCVAAHTDPRCQTARWRFLARSSSSKRSSCLARATRTSTSRSTTPSPPARTTPSSPITTVSKR